jgi:hypothetical protein
LTSTSFANTSIYEGVSKSFRTGCLEREQQMVQFSALFKSRDSSVSIALGWTIGVLWFDSRRGLRIFLFTTASRTALGPTQPPIQWVPGALSLGVKRSGHEADHSPLFSAEVKNARSYTSTPLYIFMALCLVKHTQGQLYLYLYFTLPLPLGTVISMFCESV